MLTGTNVGPTYLWYLRFKINTPDGGLNWKIPLIDLSEADAKSAAVKIALRLLGIMPSTCEIYAATISKSNTTKDSKLVPGALGDGIYLQNGTPPVPSVYNRFDDALLIRFEDTDGGGVSMAIAPVPDTIIVAGQVPVAIAPVTDMTAALAADPTNASVYHTTMEDLMLAVGKYSGRVKASTNIPGGNYSYARYNAAFFKRVTKKKGGRVFTK